jgi:hypothetical protein
MVSPGELPAEFARNGRDGFTREQLELLPADAARGEERRVRRFVLPILEPPEQRVVGENVPVHPAEKIM